MVRQHCEDLGRDPATVLRSSEVFLYLTDHPERRDAEIAGLPQPVQAEIRDRYLTATPTQARDQMQALVDAGVQYFIVNLWNAARLVPVQQFAAEVLPSLR